MPLPVPRVRVEVVVDRCARGSPRLLQAEADPSEGLARAQDEIGGRFVADLFAVDRILSVIEFQRVELNGGNVRVIQRCYRSGVNFVSNGEVDVAERESLGLSLAGGGVEVLGGTQEPPKGDDDEIDGVGVEEPGLRMIDVEGFMEAAEVSDVGWVGPVRLGVFVGHGLEERSE